MLLSRKTNSYARRRWLHANSLRAYADKAATAHRVTDLLDHQWTSLSEPAVLPLTTEPMPEPLLRKHHAKVRARVRVRVYPNPNPIPYTLTLYPNPIP